MRNENLTPESSRQNRRVALLYDRIPHHGAHSGYLSIAPLLEGRGDVRIVSTPHLGRMGRPGLDALVRPRGMPWYRFESLMRELAALSLLTRRKPWICHFLGGEGAYHMTGRLRRAGMPMPGKIVCTFHQPPGVFDRTVGENTPLEQLDAAVVLCGEQAAHLRERIDPKRVHEHRHHVDSRFFHPPPSKAHRKTKSLLFVGGWLRDHETLSATIHRLSALDPETRFTVLAPHDRVPRLAALPNVQLVQRLSDEELRGAYQSAAGLLLPLSAATANNTLLEAMACGLPVITTDIGGVRDYVPDEAGILVRPHDPEAMSQAVLRVWNDSGLAVALGEGGRRRAVELSPEAAGARLIALYNELANRDPGDSRP